MRLSLIIIIYMYRSYNPINNKLFSHTHSQCGEWMIRNGLIYNHITVNEIVVKKHLNVCTLSATEAYKYEKEHIFD